MSVNALAFIFGAFLVLTADDDFKMRALFDVLQSPTVEKHSADATTPPITL